MQLVRKWQYVLEIHTAHLAVLSITSLVMTGVLIGFVTRTTHGNKSEQCHRYPL